MKNSTKTILRMLTGLCLAGPLVLGVGAQNVSEGRVSLVTDWSHRYVRYSNTASLQQRVDLMRDPRALHNYIDRVWRPTFPQANSDGTQMAATSETPRANVTSPATRDPRRTSRSPFLPSRIQSKNSDIDWALSLGTHGGVPVGETPAKFQFDVTKPPDCTNDFVVFPINAAPSSTQANIIAVNNLYAGTNPTGQCGTAPTVMWAYKLGTAGTTLSPVLSWDGKKVAMVETGTRAILHVLTPVAGQGTSATAPYSGTPADITVDFTAVAPSIGGCTNVAATTSNASPYIDYSTDSAFLAADNGILYHVSGVFFGTPRMDFCTTVSANAILTSPVYDSNVNKVFISDGANVISYDFSATTGFSNKKTIAVGGANGIANSPIIDGSAQKVYIFSASSAAGGGSIVSQMPYSLASHVDVKVGATATGYVLVGAFDNNYFVNSNPATWTLYACARGSNGRRPALYAIGFNTDGTLNTTPLAGPINSINPTSSIGTCSPLLEFYNGVTDRLFVATSASDAVYMFDITSRLTNTSTPTATAPNYMGGTSGFTVDNTSANPQASSIYFGTLATSTTTCGSNTYCAVKLTQSGLR